MNYVGWPVISRPLEPRVENNARFSSDEGSDFFFKFKFPTRVGHKGPLDTPNEFNAARLMRNRVEWRNDKIPSTLGIPTGKQKMSPRAGKNERFDPSNTRERAEHRVGAGVSTPQVSTPQPRSHDLPVRQRYASRALEIHWLWFILKKKLFDLSFDFARINTCQHGREGRGFFLHMLYICS